MTQISLERQFPQEKMMNTITITIILTTTIIMVKVLQEMVLEQVFFNIITKIKCSLKMKKRMISISLLK
jgi:hypothetical protein